VWSPDGRHVYFSSLREGTLAIWRVSVDGGVPSRLTFGTGPEVQPSVSGDGRRMAYSTFVGNADIVLLDLDTGARSRLGGMRVEYCPALAKDLSRIVFCSDRAGKYDLWVQALENGRFSGEPRRLTEHPGSVALPVFSSDGRWIAYGRVLDEQRDLWVIPSEGGPPERFTDDPGVDMHPAWSPDGSRIAFVSNRDGREHVWVASIHEGRRAGAAAQLTRGDGRHAFPDWSPDGSRIAFTESIDGVREVWVARVNGDPVPRQITRGADARFVRWDAGPDGLFVSGTWGAETISVRRVDVRSGATEQLAHPAVMGDSSTGGFDVSPDGRLIVFEHEETRGDIWVLEAHRGSF
jgi:Tol biopolymer transport system component